MFHAINAINAFHVINATVRRFRKRRFKHSLNSIHKSCKFQIIDTNVMDWVNLTKIHSSPTVKLCQTLFSPWRACAVQRQFREREWRATFSSPEPPFLLVTWSVKGLLFFDGILRQVETSSTGDENGRAIETVDTLRYPDFHALVRLAPF